VSLLAKAKAIPVKGRAFEVDEDELELAIAYARDEISGAACALATDSKPGTIGPYLLRVLMQAIRAGRVKLVEVPAGKGGGK
jgi:hypothetical protein